MAQDTGKILPLFIDTDTAFSDFKAEKQTSPFMKGLSWDLNANPSQGIGTDNPSGEGQNMYVLTPVRSNVQLTGITLPEGYNKNCGTFESVTTKELYYFNFNDLGNHAIYVINGDTGIASTVVVDPELEFTDDQEGFITNRVVLRYVKDKDGNIIEKHLLWTNGKKWHGWMNVVAAIATSGFDATLFPYWTLLPPHFDRKELLEWAIRPPMIKPLVEAIANTDADRGKFNRVADESFQFAIAYQNTDGRTSVLSPYSLPLQIKSEEYLNNPDNIPKNARLTFPAGSPLTEKLLIYRRIAGAKNTLDSFSVYGDWELYDTINKYDTPPTGAYWTRTNQWAAYSYDTVFNTIQYNFDNSKVTKIISQEDALFLQTGLPQISQTVTDVDDAVLLWNNRYDYDNFTKELVDKLDVIVKEKANQTCNIPLRNIRLYAYTARPGDQFSFISQVGYYLGGDTQMRFGGTITGRNNRVGIDDQESKYFKLDFADQDAFTCYLKGTPYSTVGKWYQVNADNSMVEIPDLLNGSSPDVQEYIQQVFVDRGYFVCVFDFNVPAGRYIAAIGRHNEPSSGNYRGKSTYVMGIANSRATQSQLLPTVNGDITITTLKPNAIKTASKEKEIDCTAGDVDVWGDTVNGDVFYIYCPDYEGGGPFRFIEGYLKESSGNPLPVELFPYDLHAGSRPVGDNDGEYTDKNGFYFAKTRVSNSNEANIKVICRLNCAYPTSFNIPTSQSGTGWKQNAVAYLSDNNGGEVGDCNRVVVRGRITNIGGTLGYSNIAVSIKDGATAFTDSDGNFELIVHNGQVNPITSNIYVNSSGGYFMTIANCGFLSPTVFSEGLAPCSNCNERVYPQNILYEVVIQNNSQTSLKEGGKYNIGIAGADLAGRLQYVNVIKAVEVETFLKRDNLNATYFQMLITSALNILAQNPDIKWVTPYVSKNVNIKRYVQWVGDSMVYLDNNGNEVDDSGSAVFAKFITDSLLQTNIRSNLSLLSNYQFVKNDRVRVYDDGDGNLFDTATFGDIIDLQVLGTNYNQAAINAGLLLPPSNTVLDQNANTAAETIGLIVKYDARLKRLEDKEGFWIEIDAPAKETDVAPFFEIGGFYPVISGEIAQFDGYDNGVPKYSFPVTIDIDFWDTYFLTRSIAGKYYNHPFESPNVTDSWGANITSGGRLHVENKDAKQIWLGGDVARSDSFMKQGNYNGLATFRSKNRKNYGIYPYGEVIATATKRNVIGVICANDWFPVTYNTPYAKADSNGNIIVTSLDENLSLPLQKGGNSFGMLKKDIGTLVSDGEIFLWYDRKNTGFIKSNYGDAVDVTQESKGERGGTQSYLNAKTKFINDWDNDNERSRSFDAISGIDFERGNVYLTFRPRRSNTNNPLSYVNNRRFYDLRNQETFVYSIQYAGWLPCSNFAPESYGRLRGNWANVEFFTFAAGVPYYHNNTPNDSFLKFFGVQTEPVASAVFNKEDFVKIMQAISYDSHGSKLFIDFLYDEQTNSFSYIPINYWKEKEHINYSEILRDMSSYPPINPDELFRSMLQDGKRIFGTYAVCRFVQEFGELGKYFQLSSFEYLFTNSHTNKP